MTIRVLFVHGAGEGTYLWSRALVDSLRESLGEGFTVDYPALPNEEEPDPGQWARIIGQQSAGAVVVAHSVGGSIALRHFSESGSENLMGLFVIATPFWGGRGWTYDGYESLMLPEAASIDAPVCLYHGTDDEVVPFEHLALVADALPAATVRAVEGVGHDLGNDGSVVAHDIRALARA